MGDIYSTATQLKAIELLPPEYSFLYDTFCADLGAVEDEEAIYDYRKGGRRMAPVVHPGMGGVVMDRGGFETKKIGFCNIAPERIIENNDLKGRSFGEAVLGAMTPQQREKKMLAKDLVEMRQAIQRRIEYMVRQVLCTGKLELFRYTHEGRDKKTTQVADYGFTNNFTPTTAWDQSGAKILDDMEAMADMVHEGSGDAEIAVCAPDAAQAMRADSAVQKILDTRNFDFGALRQKYQGKGVRFIGYTPDGIEIYSYAGTFLDDDGQVKPILPSGTVLIGSRGVLKAPYGPVTQVEKEGSDAAHITYIKKQVPLRYGSIESNAIKNRLTSCPTIVPFNVDGWVKANVL